MSYIGLYCLVLFQTIHQLTELKVWYLHSYGQQFGKQPLPAALPPVQVFPGKHCGFMLWEGLMGEVQTKPAVEVEPSSVTPLVFNVNKSPELL